MAFKGRRVLLGLALASLLGCQVETSPDANPRSHDQERMTLGAVNNTLDSNLELGAISNMREMHGENDPARRHRARKFYLVGVGLLTTPPPRVDQAIREFQLALETDPLFAKAHFKLGICYYHKGRYELEIAEYQKCLAISPRYVPARLNLGHAYLAQDSLEEAKVAYLKVLEFEPNNAVARYNLGLVEYDLMHYERAREHLQKFLEAPTEGLEELRRHARDYLELMHSKTEMGN